MAEAPLLTLVRQVRRLAGGPGPATDSDADLLSRYASLRDAEAFEALVRRHGPMVWNLCRRMLHHEQDAEDAFQATFLVLARRAASAGRKGTLAGYLYRVAFRVALKAKDRGAARPAESLTAEPPCPAPPVGAASEWAEVRSIIDEEVDRLPERFRVPFVLCCLEGRTNAEAAAVLGCPRGTVDSRLSTARQRLRQRLTRRGVTLTVAAALETQLGTDATAASAVRVAATVRAALQFTTAGASAETLTGSAVLANGVMQAMNATKLTWLAAAVVTAGLLGGGAGVATFQVFAGGEPPPPNKASPGETPKPAPEPAKIASNASATENDPRVALRKVVTIDKTIDKTPLRDVLEFLSDKYELSIRIDNAEFVRMGLENAFRINDQPIYLPQTPRGESLGDVFREILSQVSPPDLGDERNVKTEGGWPVTYRVRGNQIVIVPAYRIPETIDNPTLIDEQIKGQPVNVEIRQTMLWEALQDIARMTGTNIVLDVRCRESANFAVTASLNDVRLFTALRLIADMANLKPVVMENAYYITSIENANRIEQEQNRERKPRSGSAGETATPAKTKPADEKPAAK